MNQNKMKITFVLPSDYEDQLTLAVEAAELGIWNWDLRSGETEWNPTLFSLLGRSQKNGPVNSETFFEYIYKDDRQRVRSNVEQVFQSGAEFNDEFRIVREDKEIRWLASRGRVYRDSQGQLLRISGINYDITQRKQYEADLCQSRQQFKSIIENSPDIVARFNHHLQFIFVNQTITRFTGLSPDQFMGKTNRDLGLPERLCDNWDQAIEKVFQNGTMHTNEFEFPADGEIRYLQIHLTPEFDSSGKLITVLTVIRDITERRKKQEALEQSEQRYALAQKLSGIGNWDWNIRSGIVEWSEALEDLFDIDKKYFNRTYRSFLRLVYSEDRDRVARAINACVEEGQTYHVEHRVLRSDGTIRWLRQTGNVIRDERNLAVRMLSMVRDITEEKKAEQNQRLLAEIVTESQDAIIVRDAADFVTLWNTGAERIYGYAAEEMIGKSLEIIIPENKRNEEKKLIRRARRGEHIRHFETERIRIDGQIIYMAISFSPLLDENSRVNALATIEHDITQRIEHEKKLYITKQNLEKRVSERTREIEKTNQTLKKEIQQRKLFQDKLQTMTEALIQAEENQRREIASGLHDKIIQMLIFSNIKLNQLNGTIESESESEMIKEIQAHLDETIHELRSMTFELSPPVLYELGLIPALEWLSEKFEERTQIHCEFDDDNEDKPVHADIRNMLFRGVNELLNNAAKYAGAEHVYIRAKKEGETILIEVEDDGCGFDPAILNINMNTESSFGLFNLQERIRFLQGRFELKTKPGKGTCIRMSMPLFKENSQVS